MKFEKPLVILGAPRSGTSLLQKVLRDHASCCSLPSESDFLWDQYCHPRLHDWQSEVLSVDDCAERDANAVRKLFERYALPASFWRDVQRTEVIWTFQRSPFIRKLLRCAYMNSVPLLNVMQHFRRPRRLVEKTASNCLRVGYVNQVFPDAKFLYITRDGRRAVSSMLTCWQHPTRFFTYDVPVELNIPDYDYKRWKFVLPDGWRDFIDRPLEEICAFQWQQCNEAVTRSIAELGLSDRIFQLKLEELVANPASVIRDICEFSELPFDHYFQSLSKELPIVNSPDRDTQPDKWKRKNGDLIERILPQIQGMQEQLGYPSGELSHAC